jgi:hypothetical protein
VGRGIRVRPDAGGRMNKAANSPVCRQVDKPLVNLRLATGPLVVLWWEIDGGVLIEESRRHKLESANDAGLDRMILRSGQMVQAKAVPHDNVAVRYWAILGGPRRKPIIAG